MVSRNKQEQELKKKQSYTQPIKKDKKKKRKKPVNVSGYWFIFPFLNILTIN